MTVSLCLLVFDELPGCRIDVPQLPLKEFDEVYAVDGGSKDGTVEFLEQNGIPVYRQPQKGLGAAYMHAADRSTCDAVVVFFPKGTCPPNDTLRFRPLFEAGNELVVASRNIEGARNEEDGKLLRPRKWLVAAMSLAVAGVWHREGWRIRDVLHGFKGFTVSGFRRLNPTGQGVTIDLELAVRSYKLRMKRCEFPTQEESRGYSESHFKIWPTGKQLLKYLWRELRRPAERTAGR
jgi:glycosyltransferase involved in cell wall biosynthesis